MIRGILKRLILLCGAGFALLAALPGAELRSDEVETEAATVAGWVERVRLTRSGLEMEAKLDSGAEHSSLHVERPRYFRRDGERWVRFTVEGESGRRVAFERKLVRKAAIKRHSGRSDVRPVVEIKICLGEVTKRAEVNLVDRSNFEYPMLVGRSFLEDAFLIDPSDDARHRVALECEG